MVENEFRVGCITPCLFWNKEKQLIAEVHGDDFTLIGDDANLDWFKTKVSQRFEIKHKARLGPDAKDDKDVRILNRIISWEDGVGISYEPDQRHAEILIEALDLGESNKVSTPGIKESGGESALSDKQTQYRAAAARCNYLAQDRPD